MSQPTKPVNHREQDGCHNCLYSRWRGEEDMDCLVAYGDQPIPLFDRSLIEHTSCFCLCDLWEHD